MIISDSMDKSMKKFQRDFESDALRNPIIDENRLRELGMKLDELDASIRSDRQAHAEASEAVQCAKAELDNAGRLAAQSLSDQIPDSVTIRKCQNELLELERQCVELDDLLKVPHNNWDSVDEKALGVHGRLSMIGGRLPKRT